MKFPRKSKLVSMLMLAMMCGGSVLPAQQPAPPGDLIFQPQVTNGGAWTDGGLYRMQFGNYTGETIGNPDSFLSIDGFGGVFDSGREGLIFADGRLILNDYDRAGTNLGGGYRRYLSGYDVIFGANAYYDHRDSDFANFNQIGGGLELLTTNMEWRANYYVPVGDRESDGRLDNVGVLIGNDIFQTATYQTAFKGFDSEVGANITNGEVVQTKVLAGSYNFQADNYDQVWGWKARGEAAIGNNTRLTLGVNNDRLYDTTVLLGVELAWPGLSGSPATNRSISRRFGDPVRRLQNIVVGQRNQLVDTGAQAFFINNGGGGDGLRETPQSITELAGNADFGENDVLVLLDADGPIDGNITLDQLNQQVVGSADGSGNATVRLFDGTILSLTDLGGRPTLHGSLIVSNTSIASGFDINATGWNGIMSSLTAGQEATVTDVNILDSGDDGIQLTNMDGTFRFLAGTTGGLIDNSHGDAVQITDSTGAIFFSDLNIQNPDVSGFRVNNFSGNLTAEGTTTINGAPNQSVSIVDSTGNFTFEDLAITDGSDGVSMVNADGDFTVTGDLTLTSPGDHGFVVQNDSATNIRIGGDLVISDTFSSALSLNDHSGVFEVAGTTTITDPGDQGIVSVNSSTGYTFGAINISDAGESGISLFAHTGSFTANGLTTLTNTGDFGVKIFNNSTTNASFAGINVTNTGVTGISLRDSSGSFASTAPITLDNTGSFGFLAVNYSGNIDYTDLTATNFDTIGVSFDNYSGDVTATGATQITGGTMQGLLITDSSGNFDFDSVSVTNPGLNGIALANVSGSFVSRGGTVSGITSSSNGFSLNTGTATIDLTDMIFTTTNNDVFGLVSLQFSNAGSATLNNLETNFANGSTGTIGYRIGNAGVDPVTLFGSGNTTLNAVVPTLDDGGLFSGSIEVDGGAFAP